MKRVLFSMVLLLAAGFTFAQEKSVKEAKSIANDVKPDCSYMGCSRLNPKENQ